jgi:hypothetical protein
MLTSSSDSLETLKAIEAEGDNYSLVGKRILLISLIKTPSSLANDR